MNWRIKFHFTLANMMLMMIPVAVVSAGIGFVISLHVPYLVAPAIAVAFIVGGSSAVGTLINGWKGMAIGFIFGFQLLNIVATVVVFIAGFLIWWRR